MSMLEAMAALRELVLIAASSIAAVVALLGLRTWKKQLKGRTDYELARRLLKSAYAVRDALQIVRHPWMSSEEMTAALAAEGVESKGLSQVELGDRGAFAAYKCRWQKVSEELSGLKVEAFEAEAIWGPKVREACSNLNQHANKLLVSLQLFLRHRGNWTESGLGSEEYNRIRRLVYSAYEPDEFGAELNGHVETIEEIAKPRLRL